MLFNFALKNVLRYKKRTMLTFLIFSIAVGMYILMGSILKGFDDLSIENLINFETGHFKIRTMKYDEKKLFSMDNYILNYKNIEKKLEDKAYIKGMTERIEFRGELDNGIDSYPCAAIGISRDGDTTVFDLTKAITKGQLTKSGIVIGKNLAEDMELTVGDFVFLTFRTGAGIIDSIDLEVSGFVNTPDPVINGSTVILDIELAKKVLSINGVTEIAIKTDNYNKCEEYGNDIRATISGLNILSWRTLAKTILEITKVKQQGSGVFILFIVIIALVGIINTMLMSVYEKKKEIGTLKALGMMDSQIERMFVMEGFIIGFCGAIAGIILGTLFTWYFVVKGIDVTAWTGDKDMDIGYIVMGIVKAKWAIKETVISFFVCIIASMTASYVPAREARKLEPAECLRTNQ